MILGYEKGKFLKKDLNTLFSISSYEKKGDIRIKILFIFIILGASISFVISAVGFNATKTINDVIINEKFNHLEGFKQIGFTLDYGGVENKNVVFKR